MDKLDRLVWAEGVTYTAYGLKIGERLTKAEALDRVREVLPAGWQPSESRWCTMPCPLLWTSPRACAM